MKDFEPNGLLELVALRMEVDLRQEPYGLLTGRFPGRVRGKFSHEAFGRGVRTGSQKGLCRAGKRGWIRSVSDDATAAAVDFGGDK